MNVQMHPNITEVASLGPEGPGVMLSRGLVAPELTASLADELANSQRWEQPIEYFQKRPNVLQNYEKIALILSHGNQAVIDAELPSLRTLVKTVGAFALEMADTFPALSDYQINDVDCHRYNGDGGVLGMHKDYPRNTKLIAIYTAEGSGIFHYEHGGRDTGITVESGDVLFMRAPGLYDLVTDIRPLHGATPGENGRKCVVLREDRNPAATRPYEGYYDNWPKKD